MEKKEDSKMTREMPGWKGPQRNMRGSKEHGKYRLRLYVLCQ